MTEYHGVLTPSSFDKWERPPYPSGLQRNVNVIQEPAITAITELTPPTQLHGVWQKSWVDVMYNRVIVAPNRIDAGNLTSDQIFDVTVFLPFKYKPYLELEQIKTKDTSISIDGTLSGRIQSFNYKTYKVTLHGKGDNPEINDSIVWKFNELADTAAVLPVTGSRSFLFYYHGENLTETFEYLTDVTRSFDDEQRYSLRNIARQTYQYQFNLFGKYQQEFSSRIHDLYALTWVFPLWHEGVPIQRVEKGATEIICDTTLSTLSQSSYIILVSSNGKVISQGVDSVENNKIKFKGVFPESIDGVVVYPARSGVDLKGIKSQVKSSYTQVSVEWDIKNPVYIDSQPEITCRGLEVITHKTSSSSRSGKMQYDSFDNDIASPSRYPQRANVDRYYSVSINSITRKETFETRKLIDRLQGMYGEAYIPVWGQELFSLTEMKKGEDVIKVTWIGGDNFYKTIDSLYIQQNGNKQAFEVTNIAKVGDIYEISLSEKLKFNVIQDDTLTLCRLVRVRLNSDKISIKHGHNGMSSCKLNFIEV